VRHYKIMHLAVRSFDKLRTGPENRRKTPKEFSHSLPLEMTRTASI